eukprot:COSAG05_NODE_623_length_8291_cov_4.353394_3_plen_99_part_00
MYPAVHLWTCHSSGRPKVSQLEPIPNVSTTFNPKLVLLLLRGDNRHDEFQQPFPRPVSRRLLQPLPCRGQPCGCVPARRELCVAEQGYSELLCGRKEF